jgi:adiponectin receptor
MHNTSHQYISGALIFFGIACSLLSSKSQFVAPFEEKHIITLFLVSAILCFIFSTLYHTLSAHSERIMKLFGRLDYSGIALLIMGSFIPWVYYTFYCSDQPRVVYMITISLLGTGTIIFSQWDRFAVPEYRVVRAAMFSGLGASGLIPMVHTMIKIGFKSYGSNF